MPSKVNPEIRKMQNRMAKRAFRHGKNWRQVFVDCGGMCIKCYNHNSSSLEFHEPFGEDKYGWGIFQARILLCNVCHGDEHEEPANPISSMLLSDVEVEIMMKGGYDNWIKAFHLIDRFGWLLCQEGVSLNG